MPLQYYIQIQIRMKRQQKKRLFGNMKDTTNNIMELTAVIKALEYILNIFDKEKNYNILKNNITLR